MAFNSGFIREDALRGADDGYVVSVRLPWMRALPWSSIGDLTLSVDGTPVPTAGGRIVVDGVERTYGALHDGGQGYWGVGVPLQIAVPAHVVRDPSAVRIEASAALSISYLGGDSPMVVPAFVDRTVDATPDAG
ncbi:DUF6379 domain-containing protein [Leifsonia sp. NPDC058194]|uniref:C-glycoside deglycosidase beta subunit domain-containing protein n=1 Tax=Leifsonia sp. NPDC058194 TaxID=3346374 RepID=UPI0036DB16C4